MRSPNPIRRVPWLIAVVLCATSAFTFHSASAATCNASPRLSSSFIEGWFPAYWATADWDTLYTNQKNACINQVIIQYSAQSDPGIMVTYYPPGPTVANLGFHFEGGSDELALSLTEADKTQYRSGVVVGLQLNETEWWTNAGNAAWLDNQLIIAKALANDIWSKYGSHASFAGWYLPFEIDNCQLQSAADVNTFVDHFLGPLTKTLNQLSSSKPIYISPAFDTIPGDGCGSLSAWNNQWQQLFARMKSNTTTNGYLSVIALQDGVGALNNKTSVLDAWYGALKSTITAAAMPHPITLWANTEVYYDPNVGNPMFMNLALADMKAEQPYVAGFTSFTWAENYNPQFVHPGYNATYLSYVASGSLDNVLPNKTTLTAIAGPTGSRRIDLSWPAAGDNFGVVAYRIYRNGAVLDTVYASGTSNPATTYRNSGLTRGAKYSYTVSAMDAAGNIAPASNTASAIAR